MGRHRLRPARDNNRFNGAMPFQAWISATAYVTMAKQVELQWGHAFSGMDMIVFWKPICLVVELQWGHALSGMDTFHSA